MTVQEIRFIVDVKTLSITSGTYEIRSIADGHAESFTHRAAFQGNSFVVELAEDGSEYFSVTVLVESYSIGGTAFSVPSKPINLLATFHLPSADRTMKICPESSIASV